MNPPPRVTSEGARRFPGGRADLKLRCRPAGLVFELEADLDRHLELSDLPVLDQPPLLDDLEPAQVAQRLRGALDPFLHRVRKALGRGPDDFGHLVCASHSMLLCRSTCAKAGSGKTPM